MVDRQQALRNYHARKMAGRQKGPQPAPALAPSGGGGPELSNEQKRRQRSVLGNKTATTVSSSRNADRITSAAVSADSNVKENQRPKPNLFVNTNQEYANPGLSTKLAASSGPSSISSATSNASRMTSQQKAALVASRRKQSAAITTAANPPGNPAPSVTDAPKQGSSTTGAAGGDNKLLKQMFAARRRRAQVEMSKPTKPRDSIGSVSTSNTAETAGTAGTSATLSTADSRPKAVPDAAGRSDAASSKKSVGTSRSRRALEMYLGKTSKLQPSHESGGSSVVSASSCEKSLGTSTLGTRDGLNLCRSESLDSLDNRTVGSTASARGNLPVVREESNTSLVSGNTVRLDNTSRSQNPSAEDEDDVMRANADSKDCTEATSSVRMKEGMTSQKSVRFHLSPLERLKKKAQCSPPRAATQSDVNGCEDLTAAEIVAVEEEEDDEQFVMFMTGVRSELARDHTEVSLNSCPTLLFVAELNGAFVAALVLLSVSSWPTAL